MEVSDPNTWPRIVVVGDMLDVPGIGTARILNDAYVLGWHLLEHDDCRNGYCFATLYPEAPCCYRGQSKPWNAFWMDDVSHHVHGVEIAIAVHTSSGALGMYIVRGGSDAVKNVLVPFLDHDDRGNWCWTIFVGGDGTVDLEYDAWKHSTSVQRRRRHFALPDGWDTYPNDDGVTVSGEQEMLRRLSPDNDWETACDGSWEPEPCEDAWP